VLHQKCASICSSQLESDKLKSSSKSNLSANRLRKEVEEKDKRIEQLQADVGLLRGKVGKVEGEKEGLLECMKGFQEVSERALWKTRNIN